MNIGGEERAVKFGMNQSILYCELREISINQMGEELTSIGVSGGDGSAMRDFIWSALKDGARRDKKKFPYTNYDVGDWMEDLETGQIEGFINELIDSMPKGKEDDKPKKKVTTKKS